MGPYVPGESQIWVAHDDRPLADRRDTLLHEVLHAVDHHSGANAGESVVAAFAPVLLRALRDNPDLVAYLLAADEESDD